MSSYISTQDALLGATFSHLRIPAFLFEGEQAFSAANHENVFESKWVLAKKKKNLKSQLGRRITCLVGGGRDRT